MDAIGSNKSNQRISSNVGELVPPSRGSHSSRQASEFSAMMSNRADPLQSIHGLIQPFYTNLTMMDYKVMN